MLTIGSGWASYGTSSEPVFSYTYFDTLGPVSYYQRGNIKVDTEGGVHLTYADVHAEGSDGWEDMVLDASGGVHMVFLNVVTGPSSTSGSVRDAHDGCGR